MICQKGEVKDVYTREGALDAAIVRVARPAGAPRLAWRRKAGTYGYYGYEVGFWAENRWFFGLFRSSYFFPYARINYDKWEPARVCIVHHTPPVEEMMVVFCRELAACGFEVKLMRLHEHQPWEGGEKGSEV